MPNPETEFSFADLNLPSFLLKAIAEVGYESPSPIQKACIPPLMENRDVVGMAQTGTGKTAAFALPILAGLDVQQKTPQALVLCPTRELAIQVAEAFQSYAMFIKGFHVLPIYGGQDMRGQLRGLERGAHVIVGTPGRLLDHLKRRSLNLSGISTLVLDEADEMLRMGFIDDVESILQHTPETRRVALFSATMPPPIRKVAHKYLRNPEEIRIETAVTTNENIEQFYWLVSGTNKLDALTRILEVEEFDGMIIFVRTKTATVELADKLNARGFSASPLNGDMSQQLRQRTVEHLKKGKLDIVVATDVAARGLDVERLSHVMNYDIPYDEEAYVHRIGRTGRAGRKGKAILFVAPREKRMLRSIEKTTRKPIEQMYLPSNEELADRRAQLFKNRILENIGTPDAEVFVKLIEGLCEEHNLSPMDVAVSLASMSQSIKALAPSKNKKEPKKAREDGDDFGFEKDNFERGSFERESFAKEGGGKSKRRSGKDRGDDALELGMVRYKIHVGHNDQVSPREIVGAIANEADIEGKHIGQIKIFDDYSTVDLPEGMPNEVFQILQKTRVRNKPIRLSIFNGEVEEFQKRGRPEKEQFGERPGRGKQRKETKQAGKTTASKTTKRTDDFGTKAADKKRAGKKQAKKK